MKLQKFILCLMLSFLMVFKVLADEALERCYDQCGNEYQQCVMEANTTSPSGTRSIDGRECPLMAQACEEECSIDVGPGGGNGTAGTAGGSQSSSENNVHP